jgi:protein dithiol oxidoreductase (disulfide-forming)
MKKYLMLALLAATLAACGGEKDAQTTAPAPATTSETAPNDAALMAAAEAAAKAAADPNAAPATVDPAPPALEQTMPVAAAPVAGEIPGLKLGEDYEIIKNGQPFEPLNGQIEVVEVFNHVCPACASFQPLLLSWKKRQPADVRFTYVPAAFGGNWDQFVRSYYAAQTMGIAEKAHEKVYDAIHLEEKLKGERGNDSDAELGAFYAQFGVDAKQFAGNMKSFAVTGKFNKARQYIVQQQVSNTPNVMINGKYRVLGRSFEDRFRVADIIIAHERAQAGAAAP